MLLVIILSTAQLQKALASVPAGRWPGAPLTHSLISLARRSAPPAALTGAGVSAGGVTGAGSATLAAGAGALALLLAAPLLQPASRQTEVMAARPMVMRIVESPCFGRPQVAGCRSQGGESGRM